MTSISKRRGDAAPPWDESVKRSGPPRPCSPTLDPSRRPDHPVSSNFLGIRRARSGSCPCDGAVRVPSITPGARLMTIDINRKDFLRLAGLGGVVLASSLGPWGRALAAGGQDFFF